MKRLLVLAAVITGLLAQGGSAWAHSRDRVFSNWMADGQGVTATVRLPARLASRFAAAATQHGSRPAGPGEYFIRRVKVRLGAAVCTDASATPARPAANGAMSFGLTWTCTPGAGAGPLVIRIDALFDSLPNHVHFARLRLPGGRLDERIFTYGNRTHHIELTPETGGGGRTVWALLADYTGLGITHIMGGADHLAFVLGLMLLAPGLRALLFVITGFTLGHSLTLGLAATGAATPVAPVIEALIGFTVAVVAAEAGLRASGRALPPSAAALPLAGLAVAALLTGSALPLVTWLGLVLFAAAYAALTRRAHSVRWAVALAATFGLVHGFGFAGVLQETGLPDGRLVPALLGFNIGVELGQLFVVALALAAGLAAAKLMPASARLWGTQALAAALCGLGTFWFVSRAFSG